MMREFRDINLMTTATGQALVADYYKRAPELVPLLEDHLIAERVWRQIDTIVEMLEENQTVAAIETYKAMVFSLEGDDP